MRAADPISAAVVGPALHVFDRVKEVRLVRRAERNGAAVTTSPDGPTGVVQTAVGN